MVMSSWIKRVVCCDVLHVLSTVVSSVGTTAATGNNSIWLWRSTDLGATFSAPESIGGMLNPGDYHYTLGNGHGIQLQQPSKL